MEKLISIVMLFLIQLGLNTSAHGQADDGGTLIPEVVSLNKESISLLRQGKYDRAIVVARKALEVAEQKVGPNHPWVATNLDRIAFIYRLKGTLHVKGDSYDANDQFKQAEAFYKRSLAIREKAFGPNHLEVAESHSSLGQVYMAQLYGIPGAHRTPGLHPQAELHFERALAIREKALAPNHLDVARSLRDLAFVYYSQAQFARAEPLLTRGLEIELKVLGPNDAEVALTLDHLVAIYRATGREDAAGKAEQLAAAIRALKR